MLHPLSTAVTLLDAREKLTAVNVSQQRCKCLAGRALLQTVQLKIRCVPTNRLTVALRLRLVADGNPGRC
jgi:hypothetical protein